MVKTFIKIGHFEGKTWKNLEKGPTFSEHSESPSGPTVLTEVANRWLFQGQRAGNRQGSRRPHHLPAILDQKLLLFVEYWGD